MAELMLWVEEKGLMVVDAPSQEPSALLRKLRRHEAAERELLAARGHVAGLQQVGALGGGCRACSSSARSLPSCMACFHGIYSLQEESTSVTIRLGSPSVHRHAAGHPLVWACKPAQKASIVPSRAAPEPASST